MQIYLLENEKIPQKKLAFWSSIIFLLSEQHSFCWLMSDIVAQTLFHSCIHSFISFLIMLSCGDLVLIRDEMHSD